MSREASTFRLGRLSTFARGMTSGIDLCWEEKPRAVLSEKRKGKNEKASTVAPGHRGSLSTKKSSHRVSLQIKIQILRWPKKKTYQKKLYNIKENRGRSVRAIWMVAVFLCSLVFCGKLGFLCVHIEESPTIGPFVNELQFMHINCILIWYQLKWNLLRVFILRWLLF